MSAEIFVVCREFLAPKHIDPKFLDPKHVFKELAAAASLSKGSSSANVQENVFQPEKNRRKREGYAEGEYVLYKEGSAAVFVRDADPISFLGSLNKIVFKTEEEKQ